MSRVSDSYDNVIRGVSEQVPHDRLSGQHWEQDNLISDPVRGLSRRHGSMQRNILPLASIITEADRTDAKSRNEQTIFVGNREYSIITRPDDVPGSQIDPVVCIDKGAQNFTRTFYTDNARAILGNGVSTVTAAGNFVLLASNKTAVVASTTDGLAATADLHSVWVRGGANSRTFSITITDTTTLVEQRYEYTTMSAYYEGVLDTSDIPPYNDPPTNSVPNPLYGKLVNDRVNAYNTAVNQHISAVALDITPQNIAQKLADLIEVDYPTATGVQDSSIAIALAGKIITADDGGNGELMRAVSKDVTSAELVTSRHYQGKVVRVIPKTGNALAYYLKAELVTGSGIFGEVIWRETAGINVALSFVFCIGVFKDDKLYIGETPAALATLAGVTVPPIESASSGDLESNPLPEFFGRTISYMRMFQDRLMIIAGSTVFLSRTGDYFNFFRKSVLTVANDDPIEVFAQGTEDDVITGGVQYDKNVILCGQRYQYLVPGSQAMTPNNPFVGVVATYEGANLVQPQVAGSLMFFCQRRENRLTLQRMVPGAVADRLEATDSSSQLDGYLTGTPRQIIAMTAPGAVYVRTAEQPYGFYAYSYLEGGETGLAFDSWSKWSFSSALGELVGLTADDSGVLAVTLRNVSSGTALVLDRFSRETGPSDFPYLDSMIPSDVGNHAYSPDTYLAYDNRSENFLIGTDYNHAGDLFERFPEDIPFLQIGTVYPSAFTLTSPYIRDDKDKIILDARLTVSKLTVSVANSAALLAEISTDRGKTWNLAKSWVYRTAGIWVLNTQEVAEEYSLSVPIMKENKTYRARLSSRSWLPMTVASVEWAGQAFTSRR